MVFLLIENILDKILNKLGVGTFGCCLECYDEKRHSKVAVKIIRSVKKYLDQAIDEINIIEKLNNLDSNNNSYVYIPYYIIIIIIMIINDNNIV